MNRETWLGNMVEQLRPLFAESNYLIPEKVKVSCGWTSKGSTQKAKNIRIGECWSDECSAGGNHEIFISPVINEYVEVSATLVHELIHAVVGVKNKHNRLFSQAARRLDLVGPVTATTAGEHLKLRLNAIIEKLGTYPHEILTTKTNGKKKQTARLIKIACPDCGYTARTTAQWIESGLPVCPCGESMVIA